MTINDRIKQVRKTLMLTQIAFGEKICLSQGRLTAVEANKGNVTERTIKLVCSEFNVSEHWLRTGEGDMFNPPDSIVESLVSKFDFPAIVAQMLRAYEGLDQEQQAAVLHYARRVIAGVLEGATVEEKVDAYRQELLLEKETLTSSASQTGVGAENEQNA